ncbi:MAG: hypothetical protein CGU29_08205 [Candidatus Dactylopiibacterium carminicum]|uniref:Xanthine dehydrogenase small subunit n=1 Tax=Candidatus Dactylopiibacterium carminicum TaxID=857335 RepID=A0A272ET81_9RHOO|nr:FAD binding domain-containing protein [Candidatus Dactylopiibacterium carminicum]KAF7599317.1 hypothetical protein BGI27_08555 [Candidatus Dactylopiibacterium carminicum]PAS93308.1 MAG: hypothetical protein CGU29_08205 [Candidatus Dactylopiibacterium carminicum]PAS99320.1 MAG: hypothetical protein BSR46_08585 [Candidatus Dactylopiibacterium carminicum]
MTRDEIRFWFRGEVIRVKDQPATRTVLQWLREQQGSTGTKEGCGEGDCGACTVVVATLDEAHAQGLRLRAINACIALLPTLDGKALFTVEDLAGQHGLHPVQQALVDLHGSQCGFCTPGFAMSLWADYEEQARLLAGGTDIGLWVTKQLRDLGDVIYLGAVRELQCTKVDHEWITLGAGLTLTDAFQALCADEPQWQELAGRFASQPVRNAGTLGGNVANGSPIGDSMPALIALGSRIVLQQGERVREMPLEDFYLAYQKTAQEAGEFVCAIKVPRLRPGRVFRAWKVSKRQDQDISAVCAGFCLQLDDAGRIASVRLAFGGMAATPRRAFAAEAALQGQPLELRAMEAAMAALNEDYQPIDDMRASAAYRLQVARNLLRRLWLEVSQPANLKPRLRIEEVSA